jgi:hypothetical protein
MDNTDCLFCANEHISYLKIDKKGVGSIYVGVCLNHLAHLDWRDVNTLLKEMNLKNRVVPVSEIKYSLINKNTSNC